MDFDNYEELTLSVEKSQQQANIISSIRMLLHALDIPYCRKLAVEMLEQAGRQEGIAVLFPAHPQSKNDLLRKQGQALAHLVHYVELLQEIDEHRKIVERDKSTQEDIAKLFI